MAYLDALPDLLNTHMVTHDAEFLAAVDIEWALHLPSGRSVRTEELPSFLG